VEQRNLDIDRRARRLKQGRRGNGPVIYWMSRDQRAADNWALLWAQQEAIIREKPLLVVFCLVTDYPGANLRHYLFLLRGLQELPERLAARSIGFRLLTAAPPEALASLVRECDAHALVCDFDPLRIKRVWLKQLLKSIAVPVWEVDAHNIIPAWQTSRKKEYGAYTIRPKIHRLLPDYLTDFPQLVYHPYALTQSVSGHETVDVAGLVEGVVDRTVSGVSWCLPGEDAAQQSMQDALLNKLPGYALNRNDPCRDGQSGLSPYLHFGHLSPQRLAFAVQHSNLPEADRTAFLEELVVRRELADNFCLYEPDYDQFTGFHTWAQITLNAHRSDSREYLYDLAQFDQGKTHERLWNVCQQELVRTGKLHGYLRMYWAKKILEWSASPEEALSIAIHLNDRYSLDGRDPNGYTGIAWSIGGIHDRAWQERSVFGKIRYMNERGCRRKFDVDRFIDNGTAE